MVLHQRGYCTTGERFVSKARTVWPSQRCGGLSDLRGPAREFVDQQRVRTISSERQGSRSSGVGRARKVHVLGYQWGSMGGDWQRGTSSPQRPHLQDIHPGRWTTRL